MAEGERGRSTPELGLSATGESAIERAPAASEGTKRTDGLTPAPAPMYAEDGIAIYRGDCLDVLPHLPAADLIFTSPPYNLGRTTGGGFGHYKDGQDKGGRAGKWGGSAATGGIVYTDHEDSMDPADYESWQRDVLRACWAQLSDRGAIFYNHKPRVQAAELWTPLALNPGLPVRQIIVWARAGGVNFAPTHYCPTHEWILVLARPDFRLKSRAASGLGDVWTVPQDGDNPHPAPFPIGLPGRAIESTAPRLVIDPFMGSGTTLRAAKDAGIPAIGIDKSERYCEMAIDRLAQGSLFGGMTDPASVTPPLAKRAGA
jgi:site-specific DNA-methyltransferase (adenine-specific)